MYGHNLNELYEYLYDESAPRCRLSLVATSRKIS
jgi:hypothetical protein